MDQEERAAVFSAAARDCSKLGIALLRVDGKEPIGKGWQKTKPLEPDYAAGQWSRYGRTLNMGGLLGGSRPRLSVLEADNPVAAVVLVKLLGPNPSTPTCRSGGKSIHYWFLDVDPPGNGRSVNGLEWRRGNQQVVLPPSVHPQTGRRYVWLPGLAPWEVAFASVPGTVVEHFAKSPAGKGGPIEDEILEGGRHAALLSIAGTLRRRGLGEQEILAALIAVNETRCKPPVELAQLKALAADVVERYASGEESRAQEELRRRAHELLNHDEPVAPAPGKSAAVAWEAPVPLTALSTVPVFPVEALPGWLADWALEVSREKGAAIDLAATLALGVVAGALARHTQVSPRPGWYEPTCLYLVIALDPGQRKSPIFKQAFRPVRLLERDLAAAWQEQHKLSSLTGEVLKKRWRDVITEAADDEELDSDELRRRMEEMFGGLEEPDPTPQPRLLTEDVTAEGLASLLAQHGRIVAASDEGAAIFENFGGRYTHGSSSWDVFNKAHAAVDLVVDRKSSGAVMVLDPALTLVIATQPSVLRDLWGKPGTEGRGVLARPLYSLPSPLFTTGRTPAADAEVLVDFDRRVRALFSDIPMLRVDPEHRPQPLTLTLSPEAEQVFERYEFELASRRRELGLSDRADEEGAYLGWISKLAGQTARLAAVLHAAKHWTDGSTMNTAIHRRTVEAAIELSRYFHDNALAVFGLMGELPNQRLARVILGWLANRQPDELAELTVRDVHRSRSRGITAEQVQAALRLLEAHGHVRLQKARPGGQGGRPSVRVEINPSLPELPKSDRRNRRITPHGEVPSVPSVDFGGDERA
jgi:hypothetical protein